MTFYFKPPRGEIQFHRLQECLEERLSYLQYVRETSDISDCNECFKFEYLTDGSALDRTGHFMLRILSIKLATLTTFLLESETLLFAKRLKHLKFTQVQQELKTALRHVKEILSTFQPVSKYGQFLQNFKNFCENIVATQALQHAFEKKHPQDCQQYSVIVPFTFCLSLIVGREVELRDGFAIVPCGKWTKLLTDLFLEHMRHGIKQLSESSAYFKFWGDDRLRHLFRLIKAQFMSSHHQGHIPSSLLKLQAKDVDEKSSYFPPCMRNMHETLRLRHRLSHYSRFYYSLFLKDIGMSLMESIEFWSQEYVQSKTSCSSCSHTWQKDSKRFSYSIRHLYGLEGSRREYHSPSCCQIQAMSHNPSSDGGCPFVTFDHENLNHCLHEKVKSMKSFVNFIQDVKQNEGPNAACKVYFKMLLDINTESLDAEKCTSKQSSAKDCLFSSPSQFFFKTSQFPVM